MEQMDKLKALLGERAARYSEDFLGVQLDMAAEEIQAYTGRQSLPPNLDGVVLRVAVLNINRTGSEGLTSQGYSGISEGYIDGYPADLRRILNAYRRVKVL